MTSPPRYIHPVQPFYSNQRDLSFPSNLNNEGAGDSIVCPSQGSLKSEAGKEHLLVSSDARFWYQQSRDAYARLSDKSDMNKETQSSPLSVQDDAPNLPCHRSMQSVNLAERPRARSDDRDNEVLSDRDTKGVRDMKIGQLLLNHPPGSIVHSYQSPPFSPSAPLSAEARISNDGPCVAPSAQFPKTSGLETEYMVTQSADAQTHLSSGLQSSVVSETLRHSANPCRPFHPPALSGSSLNASASSSTDSIGQLQQSQASNSENRKPPYHLARESLNSYPDKEVREPRHVLPRIKTGDLHTVSHNISYSLGDTKKSPMPMSPSEQSNLQSQLSMYANSNNHPLRKYVDHPAHQMCSNSPVLKVLSGEHGKPPTQDEIRKGLQYVYGALLRRW